jgi:hypothetical protein
MCIYTCIYVHIYIYIYMKYAWIIYSGRQEKTITARIIYIYIHIYTYIFIYGYIYIYLYIYIYIYIYILYIYIYIYIYICIHICVYIYIYIHIYIYMKYVWIIYSGRQEKTITARILKPPKEKYYDQRPTRVVYKGILKNNCINGIVYSASIVMDEEEKKVGIFQMKKR